MRDWTNDEDDPTQRAVDAANFVLSRLDHFAADLRAIAGHLETLCLADLKSDSDDLDRLEYLTQAAQWAGAFGDPGDAGLAGVVRTQSEVMRSIGYGHMCGGNE